MTKRLSHFIRDSARRSVWACPVALLQFSISQANKALVARFQ